MANETLTALASATECALQFLPGIETLAPNGKRDWKTAAAIAAAIWAASAILDDGQIGQDWLTDVIDRLEDARENIVFLDWNAQEGIDKLFSALFDWRLAHLND